MQIIGEMMVDEHRGTKKIDLSIYTVQKLESLAVYLWTNDRKYSFLACHWMLQDILAERRRKLNTGFQWTDENKQRLLAVNDKLMEVFGKAHREALAVAESLEARIANNDPFLKDYEIEIELTPYIGGREEDDGFVEVLADPIHWRCLTYDIGHCHYDRLKDEVPIYLDGEDHCREFFGDLFEGHRIGYAIHELLDTPGWSFPDILSIGKVWADVKVVHQYDDVIE